MFGEKAAKIVELEEALEIANGQLENSLAREHELEGSVLSISGQVEHKQEEYNTLYKSFQDVAQKNCDLNVAIADQSLELDAAETFLSETQECNEVLHEENSDLVRQLELYKAVLGQLSIVVKVPARRKK